MSKKTEDPVFRLIKQMTKNEKRHFTMSFGQQTRKPIYFLLFDEINKMDQFNPQQLKEVCSNNLSRHKIILYDKILQAMRDYESSNAKSVRIKELLVDARYLLERSLYDLGEARLEEAKKLAVQIDDQLAMLEINRQERHLVRMNTAKEVNHQILITNAIEEKDRIIQNCIEEYSCLDRYDLLFARLKTNIQVDKRELKKLFPPKLFDLANKPNTLMAKRRFFQSGALFYQLLGDPEKLDFYYAKVIDWWENNIEFRKEAYYWYIADLSNFLQAYLFKNDLEGLERTLRKLEEVKGENEHTRHIAFYAFYSKKISFLILSGQFDEAKSLIVDIKRGLKAVKINPASRLALYFNILIVFFIHEEHNELALWIEKVLEYFPSSYRKDIQHIALILDVLICFEREEFLEKASAFKKAINHFHRKLKLPKDGFEQSCITYFNKLSKAGPSDRLPIYKKFEEYLLKLRTSNPNLTGLDALLYWTESKILRIPLIEVVRRKLK